MPEAHRNINPVFEHQPIASLDQAAPVQNTWYTILDTTTNVRIYGINYYVQATGETLELRLTIDGEVYTSTVVAVANTPYCVYFDLSAGGLIFNEVAGLLMQERAFLIEGRSIKVEVRKTTAAGAGNLRGNVFYARNPDV